MRGGRGLLLERHERADKGEEKLLLDLDDVFPEQEDEGAHLARHADRVLGIELCVGKSTAHRVKNG